MIKLQDLIMLAFMACYNELSAEAHPLLMSDEDAYQLDQAFKTINSLDELVNVVNETLRLNSRETAYWFIMTNCVLSKD